MNAIELKVARTRKGFTQEYVASCLGISTVGYSKKERGESGFSPEQITAVAKVLEMDQDQVNTIFLTDNYQKQFGDGKITARKFSRRGGVLYLML